MCLYCLSLLAELVKFHLVGRNVLHQRSQSRFLRWQSRRSLVVQWRLLMMLQQDGASQMQKLRNWLAATSLGLLSQNQRNIIDLWR